MKKITILFLSMVLLCVGCTTNKNTAVEESELAETHIGSAVLKEPVRGVNNNIYIDSGIIQTTEYKPFAKKMVVYGITFVAKDDVSDEFMLKIAKTMKEMFIQNESTDQNLQEKVLKNLYKYNALIPVFKGEFDLGSSEEEIKLFSKVEKENSICDIIMEGSGYQTLEVVEHILHTVTDVGLHYTLTDQWGITNKSMIYKSMQEAIEKKYYSISGYEFIPEGGTKDRVLIQEFAYWVISSAWNIQETYGLGEEEWMLKNRKILKASLPSAYDLFEMNIPKIMSVPSKETLDSFNE